MDGVQRLRPGRGRLGWALTAWLRDRYPSASGTGEGLYPEITVACWTLAALAGLSLMLALAGWLYDWVVRPAPRALPGGDYVAQRVPTDEQDAADGRPEHRPTGDGHDGA